jgi:hypothetical protein
VDIYEQTTKRKLLKFERLRRKFEFLRSGLCLFYVHFKWASHACGQAGMVKKVRGHWAMSKDHPPGKIPPVAMMEHYVGTHCPHYIKRNPFRGRKWSLFLTNPGSFSAIALALTPSPYLR